jgi:F420 biosynthesis protein FbiB-like protein
MRNSPNTLHQFLRSRRSVRDFTENPIPPETLTRILETAAWAPNAHNRQAWRFLVLQTEEARARLVEAMAEDYRLALETAGMPAAEVDSKVQGRAERINKAAVGVVLCYAAEDMDSYENDPLRQRGEDLMGVQSVALAGGQMLLAAHAEGLGGVWMCAPLFAQEKVRQEFDLPDTWQPQGLILMGYPAKIPTPGKRKKLDEVVKYFE